MAGAIVVVGVRDLQQAQALVQAGGHRRHAHLDDVDVVPPAERTTGLAVAGAQPERQAAQVLRQVVRVVGAPAHLLGLKRPPQRAGRATVVGRQRIDDRRADPGRRCGVDGPGQAQRRRERGGVAGGVCERAEAAHRQPGDGALAADVEGAVVAVHPGDQLLDVPVLPARQPARAVVEPVRVEAAAAAAGHDHDQRQLRRQLLGLALTRARPGGLVAARAVEQVEDRIPVLPARVIARREQDAHLRRRGQRRGLERELLQPRRQIVAPDQLRVLGGRRRRGERKRGGECERAQLPAGAHAPGPPPEIGARARVSCSGSSGASGSRPVLAISIAIAE
jgi:hypothetical protein